MQFIPRFIKQRVIAVLKLSPVVFVNGPRQAGKSTLVRNLFDGEAAEVSYVSLDSPVQMAAAASTPLEFLKNRKSPFIIDEVQMVPELFRALKETVDELRYNDKANAQGRFLITGSANIMALPKLADALVGRMSILTLYQLSAAEAIGGQGQFVEQLFQQSWLAPKQTNNMSVVEAIGLATFPEISGNKNFLERSVWLDDYITTLLQRDVHVITALEKVSVLPHLLRMLAARAGNLMNDADIAREVGLNSVTSKHYRTVLKMMFLNFDVKPWYRNIGKRLVKARKGYFMDTLLLCHMIDLNLETLQTTKPAMFGHIVENFVASELVKLLASSNSRAQLYHFRDASQKEVDFVLEKPDGTIAGIEVKTKENIEVRDFNGLQELRTCVGKDFVTGVVLYSGKDIVPFGDRLWAVPLNALWQ